jgi:hypothetical protein
MCGIARGALVSVGPFSGQLSETWESFPASHGEPVQYLANPTVIMSGAAAISHPQMVVFDASAPVSLGSSGPAQPSDGVHAMTLSGLAQTASISFPNPIVRFGAYWGAVTAPFDPDIGDPAVVNVRFYDSGHALVDNATFTYSRTGYADGLLEWQGWAFSAPISWIEYTEDGPVIDGLQADPVPEPSTLALLAVATTIFLKSRNK